MDGSNFPVVPYRGALHLIATTFHGGLAMEDNFICSVCGETKPTQKQGGTGYGRDPVTDGKVCYACCAIEDKRAMLTTGRATMFLVKREVKENPGLFQYFVTNWPGTLEIRAPGVRHGKHNIARTRTDVWFKYENRNWHGVSYGENTQICHVRVSK
jgi:hypothetical protein